MTLTLLKAPHGCLLVLIIALCCPTWALAQEAPVANAQPSELVFGMYSYRAAEMLAKRWQPLVEYLSEQLPEYRVTLRMLDQTSLGQALARGEIDLLFTNPVHYIRLRERFAMSGALVTLMRQVRDQPVSRLGGVIVTRAERTDLTELRDLAGKEVLAVGRDYLGGYITSAYELQSAGIPLNRLRFRFDPASHDEVVSAVLDGRGDAGFVRTGIIEQLEAEGRLDPSRIRIVHQQHLPGFQMLVSTRLYPEWPIMALPQLDPSLARRLAAALLLLDQDHPVAREIGIKGFDLPADYSFLETVMRELRVAPFDRRAPLNGGPLWPAHRWELWIAMLSFLLLAIFLIGLAFGNRRLLTSRAKVEMFSALVFKDLTDLREAERARQALHQRLEATFERAAVGMAHLAPDGRFLRVNTRVCELLGYSCEVLMTKRFQDLTHPDDLQRNLNLLERLLSGENASYRIEKRYFRADASWLWVLVTASLVRDTNGTPQYLIVVIENIAERKRAEETLHVSAQMVEKAAYAIIATDMDGTIRVYNPAAERLLGYPAREMLDRETPLLFHCPEELAARATELTKQLGEPIEPDFRVLTLLALRNGDEDTRQWTLRRCDGQAVIVLLSITVLRDSEGQPHGILGNLADITALRQATEALRWERDRAQRYLETVHSLVILLDVDGRITLVNPFACELLGYSQHELVGNGWLEVCVSGQERERLSRLFDRARRQFKRLLSDIPEAPECDYIETLVRCADGSERLIGWHSNLFADEGGRVVGILCAGSDMTERHAMESARAAALQEAERLADLKNAFLTNMSHEIRTPLHAILGLAQIGRRDFASEDAGPLFRRIQQSGRHLLALLNDVLDVSRMDAGKVAIHAQPFRLADHIAELKSMIRPAVSAKGLALSIDCTSDLPEWVEGDALRLHQILINLLGNAVKFTPRGEISLKVAASAERIVFSVSDPGIGMTREQMTHIFQPFEQADIGSARVHGGTGLGLAISNNLAQLMGGQLSVESEQGLGSTFELSLPLPEVVAPPEAEDSAKMSAVEDTAMGEGQRLKGLHILAVDDVEVNLMVIEDLLTHEGARLTTASHGHQALVRVYESEDNPFDLVLMDVQMPVMDGYEATRRIRSLAPNLPIIGLTAHAFPEERDRCLEAGMSAHLSKPVDIDLLVQTLRFWRSRGGVSERHAGRIMDVSAAAGQLPEAGLGALTNEPSVTLTGQIDWTGLNRRFATSPGLVARLAQAAVESEAGTAQQLRAMAASGDLDGFFHKTHALKGLAANFCAETLREQAHQCCEQARGGDADALKGAEALAQGLEALLAELAETQAAGCSVQVSAEEPSQKSIRLSRNSSQRM